MFGGCLGEARCARKPIVIGECDAVEAETHGLFTSASGELAPSRKL